MVIHRRRCGVATRLESRPGSGHELAGRLGSGTLAALVDLVLPVDCAGCGSPSGLVGICAACLTVLRQVPEPVRPTPPPAGLPACLTAGEYAGPLRELILAYKERGRRGLATPLGDALASVVTAGWPVPARQPLTLVPVPATAAAMRARHGDHMVRLARRAARTLRRTGCPARVAVPVRALPKLDSSHLDRFERERVARQAFVVRGGRVASLRATVRDGPVVLLDDVLTTGATLAAVTVRLREVGIDVSFAAVLAATRLRHAAT